MFVEIIESLFYIVYQCFAWFGEVLMRLEAIDWVIASITFALAIRLIIVPVSGLRFSQSDAVKASRRKGDD